MALKKAIPNFFTDLQRFAEIEHVVQVGGRQTENRVAGAVVNPQLSVVIDEGGAREQSVRAHAFFQFPVSFGYHQRFFCETDHLPRLFQIKQHHADGVPLAPVRFPAVLAARRVEVDRVVDDEPAAVGFNRRCAGTDFVVGERNVFHAENKTGFSPVYAVRRFGQPDVEAVTSAGVHGHRTFQTDEIAVYLFGEQHHVPVVRHDDGQRFVMAEIVRDRETAADAVARVDGEADVKPSVHRGDARVVKAENFAVLERIAEPFAVQHRFRLDVPMDAVITVGKTDVRSVETLFLVGAVVVPEQHDVFAVVADEIGKLADEVIDDGDFKIANQAVSESMEQVRRKISVIKMRACEYNSYEERLCRIKEALYDGAVEKAKVWELVNRIDKIVIHSDNRMEIVFDKVKMAGLMQVYDKNMQEEYPEKDFRIFAEYEHKTNITRRRERICMQILELFRENPGLMLKNVPEIVGMGESYVSAVVRDLKEKGLLRYERNGNTHTGRWVVNDEI